MIYESFAKVSAGEVKHAIWITVDIAPPDKESFA
jgi:hypothetical protein